MSFHQLSPLTQHHLDQATALSQAEHWPHRQEDWEMLLALSVGTVALRGSQVVGTALRTDYGPDVSAMNMIIVAQSERGHGLGRKVMEAVMDKSADRELRLIATKEGLPLYEKLGFQAEGDISQCQGNIDAIAPPGSEVYSASAADLNDIIQIDTRYTAADRSGLLRWLAQNGTLAVMRADGGEITSYAAHRRFGRGHVIGPILAPGAAQAKDLIQHFAAPLSGAFLRIDTDNSLDLVPWLDSIGLACTGTGVRMRKNAKTDPRPAFGLCSQALG